MWKEWAGYFEFGKWIGKWVWDGGLLEFATHEGLTWFYSKRV